MATNININASFPGYKEFNKTMQEYRKWNRRQPAEIINAKMYFIARNATMTTKTTEARYIKNQLNSPSRRYPEAPLAGVIINKQLGNKGNKGLSGQNMANAITEFVNRRISHRSFLRSGWLNAIKILDYYNKRGDISFVRRYAPKMATGLKQVGKAKGNAVYAKDTSNPNMRTYGEITNEIGQGKQASPTVTKTLEAGLKKAIALEIQSMKIYIQRKYDEMHKKMFNRKF